MNKEDNNSAKLSVDVNPQVFSEFQAQWKERGQVRNRAVEAAVKLWIGLPVEIQAQLINQSLDAHSFITLVRQIADEQIEAGRKVGKALLARQKRSKARKG